MAYVNEDVFDEDDEESVEGAPLVPGGGVGSAAGASSQPSGSVKKTPGKFADLSEYLRVNSPQEFGGKVADKIGEDIQAGESTLSESQDEFKSRADASTVRDSQGLIGQVDTAPEAINVDEFSKLRDAEYKGPEKLTDSADLYNRVQGAAGSAVGKANASKTEGGRFALLDNYFGRPNYTQGQKALDNLLIQNDPKAQQSFDQMRENANVLQQNVKQAGVDLGNYGTQARATTDKTRSTARGALGIDDAGNAVEGEGALGRLGSDVNSFLKQRQDQQASERALVSDAIARKDFSQLTPELRAILGLEGVDTFYDVDATPYLSDAGPLNQGTVATTDQQRRMAALSKLANLENSSLPDESLAGTMDDEALLGFDSEGLKGKLSERKGEYESSLDRSISQSGTAIGGLNGAGDGTRVGETPWGYPITGKDVAQDYATITGRQLGASDLKSQRSELQKAIGMARSGPVDRPELAASLELAVKQIDQKIASLQKNVTDSFGVNNKIKW